MNLDYKIVTQSGERVFRITMGPALQIFRRSLHSNLNGGDRARQCPPLGLTMLSQVPKELIIHD